MKKKPVEHILVADDLPESRAMIKEILEMKGYTIATATGVFDAIRVLDSKVIDLVVIDINMSGQSGINLVKYIREKFVNTEIVMMTTSPIPEVIGNGEKFGTEEYVLRPFTDRTLLGAVKRAQDKLEMRKAMKVQLHKMHSAPFGIIGKSRAIKKVIEAIEKTAQVSATVIITGESGTGKELVARAVHYCSPRASAPFVAVNCGSIPETLMESELFGHVKGAFTGAFETRPGFFHTADVGTIFLDEISETSQAMQVKLLRVLQEKEICMVGSRRTQKIDVRVLASTNRELPQLVEAGLFRADLYYRLNVINISIPPLRDRGEDISLLIQYFTAHFAKELDKPVPQYSDQAMAVLKNYKWPGNVRELESVIHRLVLMIDEKNIDVAGLRSVMGNPGINAKHGHRSLEQVELEYIKKILDSVDNNRTQAAKILGIDRKTLREKIKKI
jgi:DNA-binding NtrC family response regulator